MKPSDMTEDQKRQRGRPRVDEPGSTVSTWLPKSEHDRLIAIATRRGDSVSAIVRRLLTVRLQHPT